MIFPKTKQEVELYVLLAKIVEAEHLTRQPYNDRWFIIYEALMRQYLEKVKKLK